MDRRTVLAAIGGLGLVGCAREGEAAAVAPSAPAAPESFDLSALETREGGRLGFARRRLLADVCDRGCLLGHVRGFCIGDGASQIVLVLGSCRRGLSLRVLSGFERGGKLVGRLLGRRGRHFGLRFGALAKRCENVNLSTLITKHAKSSDSLIYMQAQPLELRAPEGAIRSDRTTGAAPFKPVSTAQLTGPAVFIARLGRRQNSRRLAKANDLRMGPQSQIQHRCAAVAKTTDEQQLQAIAAHRL